MWAAFNMALGEISTQKTGLVHARAQCEALTKAELRDLCEARGDLLQHVRSFGSEIPTTNMFWKRECNTLEWVVRQMSWMPPWVQSRSESALRCADRREARRSDIAWDLAWHQNL